jgi:hypothetical protein
MYMKFTPPRLPKNSLFLVIIFIGFIILVNLLYGTAYDPRPYYPTSIFAKQFPLEGFENTRPNMTPNLASSAANFGGAGAVDASRNSVSVGTSLPPPPPPARLESFVSKLFDSSKNILTPKEGLTVNENTRPTKKEGFELMSGPAAEEQNINYLGNTQSNATCATQSMGMSNSMGYLCLTDEQRKYLQSRGGNATTRYEF